MERNNRDRYNFGDNYNDRRFDYNRTSFDRDNNSRYDRNDRYNQYDRYDRDDRNGRQLKQQFERDYQSHHNDRDYSFRGNDSFSDRGYDNDRYSDRDDSRNYGYRDSDSDRNVNRNFRNGQSRLGDVRQGYGISSFDGTSDRYNTLNSDQREGNMQEEQPYYSGSQDRLRSSRYGGGMGDSFPNSNRGVPNYATRNFADDYGTGMGSTYGGKNYGPGTGYASGNQGGSFGNNMYGTSSGNYGGYGSMGGGTYGAGPSSSGGGSSHNSDRRISGNYNY